MYKMPTNSTFIDWYFILLLDLSSRVQCLRRVCVYKCKYTYYFTYYRNAGQITGHKHAGKIKFFISVSSRPLLYYWFITFTRSLFTPSQAVSSPPITHCSHLSHICTCGKSPSGGTAKLGPVLFIRTAPLFSCIICYTCSNSLIERHLIH